MCQRSFYFSSGDGANLFCRDAPQAVYDHFILLKSYNGRFQPYGTTAAIKDIPNFSLQPFKYVHG